VHSWKPRTILTEVGIESLQRVQVIVADWSDKMYARLRDLASDFSDLIHKMCEIQYLSTLQ